MVASITKVIRRLSGFNAGDKPLVVSLLPGGIVHLKPLGTSRAEEASVDALTLYQRLRAVPDPSPVQEETKEGDRPSNHAVLRRLKEKACMVMGPDEVAGKEAYYVTVRVLALIRSLEEEFAEAPPVV